MLNLVYCDPQLKPATYSRFVLPFGYQLTSGQGANPGGLRYKEIKPEDLPDILWRKRYLTDETTDVLFRRAKWFSIDEGLWGRAKVYPTHFPDGRALNVALAPPILVLFEYPAENANREDKPDLLQVGLVILEVFFPDQAHSQPTLDDLLRFNEFFRYWQMPWEGHLENYQEVFRDWPGRFGESLPPSLVNEEVYFDRWSSLLEFPLEIGTAAFQLFPNDWTSTARRRLREGAKRGDVSWDVYADNRAFVWTCAILEGGGDSLRAAARKGSWPMQTTDWPEAPWNYGHWIRLLDVDPPGSSEDKTHLSRRFEREWARPLTYERWEEWGTFYGFSYHCGAMLGPPETNPELWKNFGQMYFDQTLLLFYIRVALFRFSARLTVISAAARDAGADREAKWGSDFARLRWDFTHFTNLYQFPLLSNQQQGLELYTLARQAMDVDALFREVQQEIEGSHDYILQRQAQKQGMASLRLSVVAIVGLPVALALSLLGMSIVPPDGGWLICDINGLMAKVRLPSVSNFGLVISVIVAFYLFSVGIYIAAKAWRATVNWLKRGTR